MKNQFPMLSFRVEDGVENKLNLRQKIGGKFQLIIISKKLYYMIVFLKRKICQYHENTLPLHQI